ncbi:MAG TPA: thiamine-phosphate kinase [Spirochaetia bacterium]|nr:thiamine-phosphate kinase [Spirochaetia bacterium]
MKIEQLGEFGLIERIRSALPEPGPNVVVGIGDDVAVLEASAESVWLATCDVQVEGAHFLREAIAPRSLGRKALAINLSDIASAGGIPRYALVSLGIPDGLEVGFIDELYAGLRDEGSSFGVEIVGGNLSRSRLGMFIDVFVLGEAVRDNIVLRSGAAPGDRIMVTGRLGDAAAGVALLLNNSLSAEETYAAVARERRDTPTPRVREGALIGALRQATAMIDVSDGLAGDLRHICEKSGVSVRLDAAKLPVDPENRALSRSAHGDEWHFALHGGEDYELLFTAPPGRAERLAQRITSETGTPVTIIGDIIPAGEPAQLMLPGGGSAVLDESGWDHFAVTEKAGGK